jgi:hypothetical protein
MQHGERPAGVVATFRAITNQPYSGAALYAGLRPTLLAVVPLVAVQQTLIDLQNSTAAQWCMPLGNPRSTAFLWCETKMV